MTTHRTLYSLFFVLILIVGFSSFSITQALLTREAGATLFPGRTPFSGLLRPMITMTLLGLLWAVYRRWRTSPQTEEALHSILYGMPPLGLILVSPDRTIRMCNPTVARIFGYPSHEIVSRKTDFLYRDRRTLPDRPREIFEALEREGFHVGGATGVRKNGETFPLEIITGTLSGRHGAVLLLRDITDRKRAEDRLRTSREALKKLVHKRTNSLVSTLDDLLREIAERKQAQETVHRLNQELERRVKERTRELETAYEDLKQIDRLKDDFLSTVSHEFRTPLTSIMSFSEILLNFPDESIETKREFHSIIYSESRRLGRLINDLLDLSKIEAGKMEWRWQQVDPARMVDTALQSVRGILAQKGLRLERDVAPALPLFYGDPDRILRVLINLLSNAVKFTPAGGCVKVRAVREETARSGSPGPHIRFSVEDSGQGIRPEDRERIFERFAQCSPEPAGKPEGTGLGLSICRRIVSAHRGHVWVESVLGQGSVFHVTFPLDRRDLVEPYPGWVCCPTPSRASRTPTLLH